MKKMDFLTFEDKEYTIYISQITQINSEDMSLTMENGEEWEVSSQKTLDEIKNKKIQYETYKLQNSKTDFTNIEDIIDKRVEERVNIFFDSHLKALKSKTDDVENLTKNIQNTYNTLNELVKSKSKELNDFDLDKFYKLTDKIETIVKSFNVLLES